MMTDRDLGAAIDAQFPRSASLRIVGVDGMLVELLPPPSVADQGIQEAPDPASQYQGQTPRYVRQFAARIPHETLIAAANEGEILYTDLLEVGSRRWQVLIDRTWTPTRLQKQPTVNTVAWSITLEVVNAEGDIDWDYEVAP